MNKKVLSFLMAGFLVLSSPLPLTAEENASEENTAEESAPEVPVIEAEFPEKQEAAQPEQQSEAAEQASGQEQASDQAQQNQDPGAQQEQASQQQEQQAQQEQASQQEAQQPKESADSSEGSGSEEKNEETILEPLRLTVDDIDDKIYDGQWKLIDNYFEVYIPLDWNIQTITDDGSSQNLIFQATSIDGSGSGITISKLITDYVREKSLETVAAKMKSNGYSSVRGAAVNKIPAATYYDSSAENTAGLSFFSNLGDLYTVVVVMPDKDEDSTAFMRNLFASIRLPETETKPAGK